MAELGLYETVAPETREEWNSFEDEATALEPALDTS
jgi:hypothetical protein